MYILLLITLIIIRLIIYIFYYIYFFLYIFCNFLLLIDINKYSKFHIILLLRLLSHY